MENKVTKTAVKAKEEQKKVLKHKRKPYRDIADIFQGKILYDRQEDIFNLLL